MSAINIFIDFILLVRNKVYITYSVRILAIDIFSVLYKTFNAIEIICRVKIQLMATSV